MKNRFDKSHDMTELLGIMFAQIILLKCDDLEFLIYIISLTAFPWAFSCEEFCCIVDIVHNIN